MPTNVNDKLISWASDVDPETIRQAEKTAGITMWRLATPTSGWRSTSRRRSSPRSRRRRSPSSSAGPGWMSCSHGAGRRHSRTQAKKLFTTADLAEQMRGKVWLDKRAHALVDEIPSAYKDIDQVMADQADLVEVRHTLHQVLNYKGT